MELKKMPISKMPLKGRDFITTADFSADELNMFIDTAFDLKRKQKRGNR